MSERDDELAVLEDARERKVRYRDETLSVTPLTIGRVAAVTRAARPIIEELSADVAEGLAEGGGVSRETLSLDKALDWIDRHGDRLIDAMAAATGRDRAWIADGQADEFLELVVAVLAVNLDFFARRLLPNLVRQVVEADDLVRRGLGSGRTPSRS